MCEGAGWGFAGDAAQPAVSGRAPGPSSAPTERRISSARDPDHRPAIQRALASRARDALSKPSRRGGEEGEVLGEDAQGGIALLRGAAAGSQGRAEPTLALAGGAFRMPALAMKPAGEVLRQRVRRCEVSSHRSPPSRGLSAITIRRMPTSSRQSQWSCPASQSASAKTISNATSPTSCRTAEAKSGESWLDPIPAAPPRSGTGLFHHRRQLP